MFQMGVRYCETGREHRRGYFVAVLTMAEKSVDQPGALSWLESR
jgi:hypothetical protein